MPEKRIKDTPTALRDQLNQAATGATALAAGWPAGAPTAASLTAAAAGLNTKLTQLANLEAQIGALRAGIKTDMTNATNLMRQVDRWTDSLYTPQGSQKINFGLTPKAVPGPGGTPGEVDRVVIEVIADGTTPGSLFVDFRAVDGAAGYEVEWFTDSGLTMKVGNRSVTASEIVIEGLTKGTQYWVRVRAFRGGVYGPWSDPATRVANV